MGEGIALAQTKDIGESWFAWFEYGSLNIRTKYGLQISDFILGNNRGFGGYIYS